MRKPSKTPVIEKARLEDIEAVLFIEKAQFSHPTKKEYFISELDHQLARFYVCRLPGSSEIVGFFICWVIEDTMELHDIAAAPAYQGHGIGAAMLKFILDMAAQEKVTEIFLEVRASNSQAINFYKKFNFIETGCRKNYYNQPVEDAIILMLVLEN